MNGEFCLTSSLERSWFLWTSTQPRPPNILALWSFILTDGFPMQEDSNPLRLWCQKLYPLGLDKTRLPLQIQFNSNQKYRCETTELFQQKVWIRINLNHSFGNQSRQLWQWKTEPQGRRWKLIFNWKRSKCKDFSGVFRVQERKIRCERTGEQCHLKI